MGRAEWRDGLVGRRDVIELFDLRSVPLWTAFFAGVVSVVGLIIAKELRVSDFRQAWIDALRGEIASLIARVNAINEWRLAIKNRRVGEDAVEGGALAAGDSAEEYKFVHPDVFKMEEALATIELRLNPKEDKATPLLEKAEAVVHKVRLDKAVCRKELKNAEKLLLDESKTYLKGEWDLVKKGELRYRCAVRISMVIAGVGVAALVLGFAGWLKGEMETASAGGDAALHMEDAPTAGTVAGRGAAPEGDAPATAAGTAVLRVEEEPAGETATGREAAPREQSAGGGGR